MKKALSPLLVFLLVSSTIFSLYNALVFGYAITVDGDPSDWLADASAQSVNTGMYYTTGEYIWKDAAGDDVGDGDYMYPTNSFFVSGMVDILEFRVTYDAYRMYFLIKLGDVTNAWGAGEGFCGIFVTIHIDKDRVYGSGQEWTAQGMDAKLDPSCWWEYVIVLHGFGSWIMDSSWTTVGWTGNGMEVKGSESNNCIEVAVDYDKIGSFIGQTWRFTVQVGFEEWSSFREVQENVAEWSPGGGVSDPNGWVECDAFDACFYTSTTSQTQDWSDYDQSAGNPTILCNTGEGFMDISHGSIIPRASYEKAVIKVADRLVALQSPSDFGWDWIITGLASHSPNPSAANIYGVTALELLDAYKLTSDTKYFDAAKAVADYLVSLGSNRYHYQFDLEFLIEFAKISGDASYKNFASDVWTWIKTNMPEFADGVTLYNWYYTTRYPDSHGGAVWGTGDWAIVAFELGDTAWATDMANVIADNYTKIVLGTDPYGYEYVGWGKALKAFHAVDPIAYADEIADIVSILTPLQQADGSFTGWVQDEAYVIMGLISVGEIEMANKSAVWLIENQGYNSIGGGWKLPDGNEYSEVTSEAGQAIFRVIQAIGTVDLDHYGDGIVDVKTMTIGQAIKAAYPGDTIVVHDGIYYENLIINKPLTLTSASLPIIDGGAAGNCITISANNVVINGFEIRNGYNGIIGETDGSTFSNNVIHNNLNIPGYAGVGILLWGDNDNNLITGNTIYSNDRQGIFIGYSDTSKISTGNTISHNTIYNNGLYRYANGPDASAYGVQLWCADNNIIEYNEIYGHDDWFPYPGYPTFDFAQGIYLCASFNNIVRDNNLHDNNYGVGVWAAGRTPVGSNQINYNNIAGNTGFGVRTFDTVATDARFNWWGDASGPTHSSNSGGIGDKISDYVDYSPWLGNLFQITPRTYHVNPTGAPNAIQEAIDEASSGDTIIVHEGTYNEALYISKSLTIKGGSLPVIKGSGTFTTNYMGAPWTREAVIFVVDSTDVVLESLDIEGENLGPGYNDGVVYVYSSGEIRNCIVSPNTIGDMYSLGVEARASDLNIIETTIENFGRIGAYFANCTGGVYNSTIIGQVYSDADKVNYGIEVEPHQGVRGTIKIIGNEIYNSDNTYLPEPTWSSAGIVIDGWKEYMDTPSSTVIILYNNIHDNYYGIEAAANPLSYAHYNNIYNNREYGVISAPDYQGNNATFDARYNWWGHETGPYHGTSWNYMGQPYGPHYGLGDNVSDYVLYYPWLGEPSGPPVQPPTASFTYSPLVPKAGEIVTFDASSSAPNGGTIIEYRWDFGDGNITTTSNPLITHIYANPGTYNVNLTVTDSESLKDSTLKTIVVIPAIQITINVEPSAYYAKCLNETFTIYINIYNVTEDVKLVGFEFKLRYNSTLLKVLKVENGTFLDIFAIPPSLGVMYFGPIITSEYIQFAGLLLPDENGTWHEPFPNGNGTLAIITFQAIYQPIGLENPAASCNLTLFNTKLGDTEAKPISHSVEHGYYEIVPTPMGDLNFDGKTDIFDAIIFATSFGATPSDPRWNPYADLYKDEIIDIFDAIIMGNHFGEQRPDP